MDAPPVHDVPRPRGLRGPVVLLGARTHMLGDAPRVLAPAEGAGRSERARVTIRQSCVLLYEKCI